jgi:Glycosyl transferase family 2
VLALFMWGFALYGMFVALWKLLRYLIARSKRGVPVTAVLVVEEGASYIEGILRTLTDAEPFVGRDLDIVVIDCGSKDETVHIVEALAEKSGTIRLIRTEEEPYMEVPRLLYANTRSVLCLFDMRGKVKPLEVVPTLAAFWSDRY